MTPDELQLVKSLVEKVSRLEKRLILQETVEQLVGTYTNEAAQDAVGNILLDSATIDFTYSDPTPSITAIVINDSITFAKMQNVATDSLIGRDTAGTGDPENILLNATLSMDGSGNLQRAALSGDISASAGSNTTAIGANKVLTAMINDAQVTLAKMANLAQSTIIGRAAGAGTGVPTALSVAQVVAIINATLDHNALTNLTTGDVHTHYALLAGRSGGQTLKGGTASGDDLTLQSTANATKGTIFLGAAASSGYDEVNDRLGIGTASPAQIVDISKDTNAAIRLNITNPNASTAAQALLQAANDLGDSYQAGITGSGFTPSGLIGADEVFFQANSAPLLIRTTGADIIRIATNGSERVRIDSSGNVGIGQSTPAAQLDVLQGTLGNAVQQLASTATNDDPTEIIYQNRVATTNNTVTTLHTFAIASSTNYVIKAMVYARRTGGASGATDDGAAYPLVAYVKGASGTAVLALNVQEANYGYEDQVGWDATFDVTGATARVRVTGATSNTITWHMVARVYPLST